jgi:crotonobetainyl-CoA:carnitine CoA-transferase CaiB-like acyl-CoA transferase
VPYQLVSARDRPLVIAVGNDAQWVACAHALGAQAMADDPSLATNAGRVAARERVVETMRARICEETSDYWIARLDRAGVPCGIVRTVLESLRELDASPRTGVPPSVPGEVRLPPPGLDEHGAEIRALGWRAFGEHR